MPAAATPTVSVVVPTTEVNWVDGAACAGLAAAVREAGGELIVATAHAGARGGGDGSLGVTVLAAPGASVFELRAAGVNRARASIVALTEDHAVPPPTGAARSWRERRRLVDRRRPAELWGQVRRSVAGKPLPARARAGLALVPLLCAAHALGEWAGAFAGPGRSPRRLR